MVGGVVADGVVAVVEGAEVLGIDAGTVVAGADEVSDVPCSRRIAEARVILTPLLLSSQARV